MPQSFDQIFDAAQDHHAEGRLSEAVELYRRALELRPDDAACLYFLGCVHLQLGRAPQAADFIRRAIASDPSVPEYHCDLASVLFKLNDLAGSISAAREAIELRADFPQAWITLGNALCKSGQFDEGIDAYQRVIALGGESGAAVSDLGMAHFQLGEINAAIGCFDRVLALNPADVSAHSNRIYAMHFSSAISNCEIRDELAQFNRRHAEPLKSEIIAHRNQRTLDRPLRIGYVSADLREHVVGWNMLSWLPEHDANRFQTFIYSSAGKPDQITLRLKACAHTWRDVASLSDAQLAAVIREDQIDILVDLSLHTSGNRLLAFARKPAPVQVTYLAYPGSSGLATMDYRLSDPILGRDDHRHDYTEQTLCLPKTYWCYRPGGATPDVVPAPVVQNGFITFGCLNQFQKISEGTLDAWQQVLRLVQNSRLLLHAPVGKCRARIFDEFGHHGIDDYRIEFVDRLPWVKYIQTYQRIDIALDPFQYNGGITSCDALWMGNPVITLNGSHAVGRSGASILSNLQVAHWVADSLQNYISLASSLASDIGLLNSIRMGLRQRMIDSPLMNGAQFARDIESAYLDIWDRWVRSISA